MVCDVQMNFFFSEFLIYIKYPQQQNFVWRPSFISFT